MSGSVPFENINVPTTLLKGSNLTYFKIIIEHGLTTRNS